MNSKRKYIRKKKERSKSMKSIKSRSPQPRRSKCLSISKKSERYSKNTKKIKTKSDKKSLAKHAKSHKKKIPNLSKISLPKRSLTPQPTHSSIYLLLPKSDPHLPRKMANQLSKIKTKHCNETRSMFHSMRRSQKPKEKLKNFFSPIPSSLSPKLLFLIHHSPFLNLTKKVK
jgi:hypothetical protein